MENKCQKDLVSSFPRIWTHIRTLVIYQCFFFLLPFVGLSSFVLFYFLLNATILFLFRLVYFCRNNSKALANFLSVRKYTQMTNSGSSSAFWFFCNNAKIKSMAYQARHQVPTYIFLFPPLLSVSSFPPFSLLNVCLVSWPWTLSFCRPSLFFSFPIRRERERK